MTNGLLLIVIVYSFYIGYITHYLIDPGDNWYTKLFCIFLASLWPLLVVVSFFIPKDIETKS